MNIIQQKKIIDSVRKGQSWIEACKEAGTNYNDLLFIAENARTNECPASKQFIGKLKKATLKAVERKEEKMLARDRKRQEASLRHLEERKLMKARKEQARLLRKLRKREETFQTLPAR